MTVGVRVDAPAKINLRLLVLARETSGYHSLETVFCGVSLSDRLTVAPAEPGIHLDVVGDIDTGPPGDNLVVRAARAFYGRIGREPAVRIRLEKRIPSAAGLGGGSSDAAATLKALALLHPETLGLDELLECAAGLGSDVPFFLSPTPFALAWGRGERLLAVKPPSRRTVVIAHPGVGISTAEAYRSLAERYAHGSAGRVNSAVVLDRGALGRWENLAHLACNDFDQVARDRIPGFDDVLSILQGAGSDIAMLAGSGSAIFGVFSDRPAARDAASRLEARGLRVWTALTLAHWPIARTG